MPQQQQVKAPDGVVILSGAILAIALLSEVTRRITQSPTAQHVKESLHPPHITRQDEVVIVALIRNLLYRIGTFARGGA